MRRILFVLVAALPLGPSNLAALQLSLSPSLAVPIEIHVGETLKLDVDLSGVSAGQELSVLAATVSLDGEILSQPVISPGDILPRPLHNPLDFVSSSDVGLADATFLSFGLDEVHHISTDGTFYSFDVTATAEGLSNIAIDFLHAAMFDERNPNEPMLVEITPSEPVQIQVLPPQLQAGDADQDLDFDQLDLVKVSVPFLYRSGLPATWGDGDWNGAPGGRVGAPPAGDGFFDQRDVIAALRTANYLTGPYAARSTASPRKQSQPTLIYVANSGELTVQVPEHESLTSISINSASGVFVRTQASGLNGFFDIGSDTELFKATFGGTFDSISFGPVALRGLDEQFLASDLTVIGTWAGGGGFDDARLIFVVPEPSTITSLALSIILVVLWLRLDKRAGHETGQSVCNFF